MSVATRVTPDLERAYQALQNGAAFVDRSDRLRMRFSGAKAAESLNGLVTSDVAALTPGQGQYAAALTPKGKVIADVRIFSRADEMIVDVSELLDDSALAQEVDMDRLNAISYSKGCYTGQETVARVHFRGHVNRLLRGLRFDAAIAPPSGTELIDAEAKVVGTVRSGAVSPRFGAIALGLVRREIEPGTALRVQGDDGMIATVVALPFTN